MPGEESAEESEPGRTPSPPPLRRWSAVPGALSALAEGYLRDSMIIGTATLALLVSVGGLLSGSAGRAATGVIAGVGGAVLLVATVAKHRSIGRQWLTIVVVLAVQIALIAAWAS